VETAAERTATQTTVQQAVCMLCWCISCFKQLVTQTDTAAALLWRQYYAHLLYFCWHCCFGGLFNPVFILCRDVAMQALDAMKQNVSTRPWGMLPLQGMQMLAGQHSQSGLAAGHIISDRQLPCRDVT
jgi:hypothetical protein